MDRFTTTIGQRSDGCPDSRKSEDPPVQHTADHATTTQSASLDATASMLIGRYAPPPVAALQAGGASSFDPACDPSSMCVAMSRSNINTGRACDIV